MANARAIWSAAVPPVKSPASVRSANCLNRDGWSAYIHRPVIFRILIALLLSIGVIAGAIATSATQADLAAGGAGKDAPLLAGGAIQDHLADALPPILHGLKSVAPSGIIPSAIAFLLILLAWGMRPIGPIVANRRPSIPLRTYLRNSALLI